MLINPEPESELKVYHRLIALWVVCEAFGGGIMHGLRIPFTGMLVNSLAIICITLIAWNIKPRNAIIKATIIVALFKLMLSPHSPPTAYIAVFFQGFLGHLLFSSKKFFTVSAIILAVVSLVESAVQRLLVLIIIYGNTFWEAVETFLQKLAPINDSYTVVIAITYISIHAITGIGVGYYASKLARNLPGWHTDSTLVLPPGRQEINTKVKKKKIKTLFIIAWGFLLFFYVESLINPESAILSVHKSVSIILRMVLIILTWILIMSPLMLKLLNYLMASQKQQHQATIKTILGLLPEITWIFSESWKASSGRSILIRIKLFMKILLVNIITIHTKPARN